MVCVLLSGQWISIRVLRVATCPPRGELTLTLLKVSAETLIAVVLLCWAAVICSACVKASVADDFQGAAWNNMAALTSVSLGGLSVCMCVWVFAESFTWSWRDLDDSSGLHCLLIVVCLLRAQSSPWCLSEIHTSLYLRGFFSFVIVLITHNASSTGLESMCGFESLVLIENLLVYHHIAFYLILFV